MESDGVGMEMEARFFFTHLGEGGFLLQPSSEPRFHTDYVGLGTGSALNPSIISALVSSQADARCFE